MGRKQSAIQLTDRNSIPEISMQDIVEAIQDELLVIDSVYRVKWANSAALAKLKAGTESPIGKLCYKVFFGRNKPCSTPLWDCPHKKVLKSGSMTTVIHPVHTLGTETYVKIVAYPLRDSHGKNVAIVELMRDVSMDKELNVQIFKRHHQLVALNRISDAVSGLQDLDTILNIALDNVLDIINGTIGGILFMDKEPDTLYYRIQRGLSAGYANSVRIPFGEGVSGRVAKTGNPIILEDISKDSRTVNKDLVSTENLKGFISVPLKAKDKVVGVMNIASHEPGKFSDDDVALLNSISNYLGIAIEQSRLYARLTRGSERYRSLLQHSLTAQENERKRVARELHDETSQALTSLTLSLQAAIQMVEMQGIGDPKFLERLKKAHSYAVHASYETVKLMKELRPTLLDELGMPAAIHRYAKDTLETKGISVSMEVKGTEDRLQPEVEVTFFRIAQGLIGNILQHSEAKNVTIKLDCSTSECILYVDDDGKGFDINKLTRVEPSGRGAGLFTMRERISLIGGTGYVESQPGKGTRVVTRAPLNKDMAYEEDKGASSR
ncbi:GAF domain-containing protein [Chloroflexota bacterium]